MHALDLRPGGWRVDVVFEHPTNRFQTRFGHLVDEGFEFVAGGHNGDSIALFSRLIKDIIMREHAI